MSMSSKADGVRLHEALRPSKYDVEILVAEPSSEAKGFLARETVTVTNTSNSTSQVLKLHAAASVEVVDGSLSDGARIDDRSSEDETITFTLGASVAPGASASLAFTYRGVLQHDMKGLYKSTFRGPPPPAAVDAETTPRGEDDAATTSTVDRHMFATHMEPVAARHMFVCLDQPASRSDFNVTFGVLDCAEHADYSAYSGGPLKNTERAVPAPEWAASLVDTSSRFTLWQFDTVPKVPPYLVALYVGPAVELCDTFQSTASGREVPVRVVAAKGRDASKLQFTMKVTLFSLRFFEHLFGAPYPLPKLDFALVPDFAIGGQENWGLILAYEGCLVDESKMTTGHLQRLGSLVAHEVSHNWFGNLVGIDWWESLWLKEGFATFCGNRAIQAMYPHVESGASESMSAMETDMYEATHPVEVAITHPSLITQIFDNISYSKGQALVLMVAEQLGLGPLDASSVGGFETAVAAYVNRFAFDNTTTHQLWRSLEETSGKPIVAVMDGFVTQPGHPIITVDAPAAHPSSDGEEAAYRLSQCRAYHVGENRSEYEGVTWRVPVSVSSAGSPGVVHRKVVLESASADFTFAGGSSVPLLNIAHTGFFRVCYSTEWHWQAFLAAIPGLDEESRMFAIDDVFALYNAGKYAPSRLLDVARVLIESDESSAHVLGQYAALVAAVVRPLLYFSTADTAFDSSDASVLQAYDKSEATLRARRCIWRLAAPIIKKAVTLGAFAPAEEPGKAPEDKRVGELRGQLWFSTLRFVELAEWWAVVATADDSANLAEHPRFAEDARPMATDAEDHVNWYAAVTAAIRKCIGDALALPTDAGDAKRAPACYPAQKVGGAMRYGPQSLVRYSFDRLCADADSGAFRASMADLARQARSVAILSEVMDCNFTATNGFRSQGGHIVVFALTGNNTAWPQTLWRPFLKHWDSIVELWGSGQFRIQKIVEAVGTTMLFPGGDAEFDKLLGDKPCPNATLAGKRASERVRFARRLAQEHGDDWAMALQ